jgi:hypothetical protein
MALAAADLLHHSAVLLIVVYKYYMKRYHNDDCVDRRAFDAHILFGSAAFCKRSRVRASTILVACGDFRAAKLVEALRHFPTPGVRRRKGNKGASTEKPSKIVPHHESVAEIPDAELGFVP